MGAKLLPIPRRRVLQVSRSEGIQISNLELAHGEGETRFVASFKEIVEPLLLREGWVTHTERQLFQRGSLGKRSACVIISKDTDETIILGLAKRLLGRGVLHVMGESVIVMDEVLGSLSKRGVPFETIALAYVMAGCDYSPGTYRISHDVYLAAALRHHTLRRGICIGDVQQVGELLTLLAYLEKLGYRQMTSSTRTDALEKLWHENNVAASEIRRRRKAMFECDHEVGTDDWETHVRRIVSDSAKSCSELIPASDHVKLQSRRAMFVVYKYWMQSEKKSLEPELVGCCDEQHGFNEDGSIMLERSENVQRISGEMKDLVAKCSCKGSCNTRRCSCVRKSLRCIGCDCNGMECENKVTRVSLPFHGNTIQEESEDDTEEVDCHIYQSEIESMPFGDEFEKIPSLNGDNDVEKLRSLFNFR